MEKKKLNNEELNKINSGSEIEPYTICCFCGAPLREANMAIRTVGEGCDQEIELQCPYCLNWMSQGVFYNHPAK